jgi:hypothetical protein
MNDQPRSSKPNLALIALAFMFCWPLAIWMMWHHDVGTRGERIFYTAIGVFIGLYVIFIIIHSAAR